MKLTPARAGTALMATISMGLGLWLTQAPEPPPPGPQSSSRYDNPYAARQKFVYERMPVAARVQAKRMEDTPPGYTLPVDAYLAAQQQMRQMRRTALSGADGIRAKANTGIGNNWISLGPGNQGGRARAMVIDPNNPATMYVAAVTGGVFKTTDAGTSWNAIGDTLPILNNASLAMDPNDSNTLYLGTGEIFGFGTNNERFAGNGIYKSTDAGASWNPVSKPAQTNAFDFISDIVFSPGSSQRLYAATNAGIFRSDDAGSSWTTSYTPPIGTFVTNGCTDLAIRSLQGADLIIAACEISGANAITGHILRNPDAANSNSWTDVQTGASYGRIALAIAPSNPDVMYAQVANNATRGSQAILRSTDGGLNWVERVSRPADNAVPSMGQIMLANPLECPASGKVFSDYDASGQGDYDNVIAVDPLNHNVVWAGGIDLFRSDDGGANWAVASYWFLPQTADDYTHADHHGIVFHPNYNGTSVSSMYVLSDGGIQRTDNPNVAGLHSSLDTYCNHAGSGQPDQLPISWTNLNNGVVALQFYHGLPDPTDNSRYLGGSQDNGTNLGTDAGGINGWREISGGDGGYVAVDPSNPNVLFSEFTRLSLVRFSNGGSVANQFTEVTTGISDPGDSFPFINPFLMDPNNPQILWTAGDRVWRTSNQADSWSAASTAQFNEGSRASAYAVAPGNSNLVLIGRENGSILRNTAASSANANTSWTEINASNGYISSLVFEPGSAQVVYATVSSLNTDHLLRSIDGGQNWTAIDKRGQGGGIPNIPVHTIAIDPDNTQRLIVGTDLGIFVSTDGGDSWAVENDGLAPVIVENLAINKINGAKTLFAFTYGRGAYRVSLETASNNAPVANNDSATVSFNSSNNTIDVLANDTDADAGQSLTVTAVGTPSNGGSVSINTGGATIRYSPASGFSGTETFSYTIGDGNGGSASATVTVTVSAAPNSAPVANNDSATVAFGSSNNTIDVLANDTDADAGQSLTVTAVGTPSNGGSTSINTGGANVGYSPASGFSGTETFSYTISDGNGGSASATVTVTVSAAPNNAPVANADSHTVAYMSAASTLDVLANDSDADSHSLSVTAVTTPSNGGTVTIANNGSNLSYRPADGYAGSETFDYSISDGNGGTASATVTVTVSARQSGDPDAAGVSTGSGTAQLRVENGDITNPSHSNTAPTGSSPPAGFDFSAGYYAFNIEDLTPGATATVTLTLPAGSAPTHFYKVQGGTFSNFSFNGSSGAQINGNVITLTLIDGGRGDADGTANGVIQDPGAPATQQASSGGGGGGGGSLSIGLWLLAPWLLARRRRQCGSTGG